MGLALSSGTVSKISKDLLWSYELSLEHLMPVEMQLGSLQRAVVSLTMPYWSNRKFSDHAMLVCMFHSRVFHAWLADARWLLKATGFSTRKKCSWVLYIGPRTWIDLHFWHKMAQGMSDCCPSPTPAGLSEKHPDAFFAMRLVTRLHDANNFAAWHLYPTLLAMPKGWRSFGQKHRGLFSSDMKG